MFRHYIRTRALLTILFAFYEESPEDQIKDLQAVYFVRDAELEDVSGVLLGLGCFLSHFVGVCGFFSLLPIALDVNGLGNRPDYLQKCLNDRFAESWGFLSKARIDKFTIELAGFSVTGFPSVRLGILPADGNIAV